MDGNHNEQLAPNHTRHSCRWVDGARYASGISASVGRIYDGLNLCKAFASCAELRITAIDLILGRDTTQRRADPVFCDLLHHPAFARFQHLPQVNLKLAEWLQDWESRSGSGNTRRQVNWVSASCPPPLTFASRLGSGSRSQIRGGVTDAIRCHQRLIMSINNNMISCFVLEQRCSFFVGCLPAAALPVCGT